MPLAERLRALDDKVLGKPKPTTSRQYRNAFFLGLSGLVIFSGIALTIGEPRLLAYSGGILIPMALNGYLWAQGRHTRP